MTRYFWHYSPVLCKEVDACCSRVLLLLCVAQIKHAAGNRAAPEQAHAKPPALAKIVVRQSRDAANVELAVAEAAHQLPPWFKNASVAGMEVSQRSCLRETLSQGRPALLLCMAVHRLHAHLLPCLMPLVAFPDVVCCRFPCL
jgi:hypothetical protein